MRFLVLTSIFSYPIITNITNRRLHIKRTLNNQQGSIKHTKVHAVEPCNKWLELQGLLSSDI